MTLAYDDTLFSMVESHFAQNFTLCQNAFSPSYLLESPYKEILVTIARGDGKLYSVLKKSKLTPSIGEKLIEELVGLKIIYVEFSREAPLHTHPKEKLKKEHRAYRIQDKLRFTTPFMRFWFGFVVPYSDDLDQGKKEHFLENFTNHYERLRSLVYEQLCNDFVVSYFKDKNPIVSHGSYWNIHSEFDILAFTKNRQIILGECKYKERKMCANELRKLQAKARQSNIDVAIYALFCKSGFSNELHQHQNHNLLLFELKDLERFLLG